MQMLPELTRRRRGAASIDEGQAVVTPRSSRPRRRCRGARSPSGDTSSEEEEGNGESEMGSDSENSYWDSPDGDRDNDGGRGRSSGRRDRGGARGGPDADTGKGSRDGRSVAAEMALAEDDICAICGQAWVTAREVDVYIECVVQQQLQSQGKEENTEDAPQPVTTHQGVVTNGVRTVNDQPVTRSKALPTADTLNMMILCDGCDGSFHMICAGDL